MSKIKWTSEQEAVIKAEGSSLLVSAAAGSGKTAVLVERIVSRLLAKKNPLDLNRLLVVTFTNAAAREMKERIELALSKALRQNPGEEHWQKQRLLLGQAAISTLHSFCLDIVRQNYYQLQLPGDLALDPSFRITDDLESVLLKSEVLEDLLDKNYQAAQPDFLALVDSLGGERDDQSLQELVLKIYAFSRSQPEPDGWLKKSLEVFQADSAGTAWQVLCQKAETQIVADLQAALGLLEEASQLALQPGGPQVYSISLAAEVESLAEILALPGEELWTVLANFKFPALKPCRGEVDPFLKEMTQDLRKQAKEIIQDLQKRYLAQSQAKWLADLKEMAPLMNCLAQLVLDFSELYLRKKMALNLLDFSDLEFFALSLLGEKTERGWSPTKLALDLQERFVEVLVDEYQDINAVQETILRLVSRDSQRGSNLFMVGDVKQSIYGFRSAEPALFLKKYEQYSQNPGAEGHRLNLRRNFRSKQGIIDGINFLFRQLMGPVLGGLTYDREQELIFGATWLATESKTEKKAALEVHLIEKAAVGEEDLSALQKEAQLLGERLWEWQQTGQVWDKAQKAYRQVKWRDMVVLLRSTQKTAPLFLEEFRKLKIPVYAEIGSGYFAAPEVQVVLSLLKIIDNPQQDIPLTAVLFSPVASFTAEELARLRLHGPKGSFYEILGRAACREKTALRKKVWLFLRQLRKWRTFARRHSVVELLWFLYRETGYYDYVGVLPGGEQRQANLRALLERAQQFEKTRRQGLFKFLCFLKRLQDSGSDLGTARALGEKEDVVRLMSIHQSKGLEFPLVFVACLGQQFNLKSLSGDLLLERNLGWGPVWVDTELRLKYPTLAKLVISDQLKKEMLAEELRILYVAFTRAQEALILVGSLKNLEKEAQKWSRVLTNEAWSLPAHVLWRAQSPLDWLGPCLIRNQAGQPLREMAGGDLVVKQDFAEDKTPWLLKIWTEQAPFSREQEKKVLYEAELEQVQKLLPVKREIEDEALLEKLEWQYPYAALANIPGKVTVTEIKKRSRFLAGETENGQLLLPQKGFAARPQFLQKKGLTASEKGTALHLVLRYLDFKQPELSKQLNSLVTRELITEEQAAVVDLKAISRFLASALGQRIQRGQALQREVPFLLSFPAGELYPEITDFPEEIIVVQGTIDCLFQEAGEYVLVDYKTDRVNSPLILKERYQVQMELYARAVRTILSLPVKEKVIYSFYLQEAFRL